jgi:hypothetical protein
MFSDLTCRRRRTYWVLAILTGATLQTLPIYGQQSQSAPVASELTTLMRQQRLDAFAARVPDAPDTFVAAMLFPGVQLLVVTGTPTVPAAAQTQLDQQRYADVYSTLQTAVIPATKVFVQDLKADGLHATAPDTVDIVYEHVVKQTTFGRRTGDAKYAEAFATADTMYTRLLTILVNDLRHRAQTTTSVAPQTVSDVSAPHK